VDKQKTLYLLIHHAACKFFKAKIHKIITKQCLTMTARPIRAISALQKAQKLW